MVSTDLEKVKSDAGVPKSWRETHLRHSFQSWILHQSWAAAPWTRSSPFSQDLQSEYSILNFYIVLTVLVLFVCLLLILVKESMYMYWRSEQENHILVHLFSQQGKISVNLSGEITDIRLLPGIDYQYTYYSSLPQWKW